MIRQLPSVLQTRLQRRALLQKALIAGAFYGVPGAYAEALTLTPSQTEGPFYPDRMPLDTDNDLLVINDSITPAVGEVTWLSGRVLDSKGEPMAGTVVEIWQADSGGVYIHSRSGGRREDQDPHFQGFGRFLTGSDGAYGFRTIKPVPYRPRTPHIHVKVKKGEQELLTTQLYVEGERMNRGDMLYNRIRTPEQKAAVTTAFKPLKGSKAGELAARFDIVLGRTPEDPS